VENPGAKCGEKILQKIIDQLNLENFAINRYSLKVLTNEKRGGLRVISFDRPPFKGIVQWEKRWVESGSIR
jgi:hypothetical protein